ncbi:DNA photolyase [Bacillaceae bacterium JMAK1]|nr:DNA photolyase [Bacillaceae bacterium JMAK1]
MPEKTILHKQARTILTKASGFLEGYSHTLNPYVGCVYGCSYCYVRKMPIALFREESWGDYVDVKSNAKSLLIKELQREKQKGPVTIFMSSSTDPYQPIEYKEELTRNLLEALAVDPPDFLFIQTRSPMVTRDLDLFQKLKERLLVSITIETDDDSIRKQFSPQAPAIRGRLRALKELHTNDIQTQAAIAPLLPSSPNFPAILREHTSRITIDDFFMGDGSGGKRTKQLNIQNRYKPEHVTHWYDETAYKKLLRRFQQEFRDEELFISQQGFLPPT